MLLLFVLDQGVVKSENLSQLLHLYPFSFSVCVFFMCSLSSFFSCYLRNHICCILAIEGSLTCLVFGHVAYEVLFVVSFILTLITILLRYVELSYFF